MVGNGHQRNVGELLKHRLQVRKVEPAGTLDLGVAEQPVHRFERRRPLRRRMELRPHAAQRPVRLGRQQQHHERGEQRRPCGARQAIAGDQHEVEPDIDQESQQRPEERMPRIAVDDEPAGAQEPDRGQGRHECMNDQGIARHGILGAEKHREHPSGG